MTDEWIDDCTLSGSAGGGPRGPGGMGRHRRPADRGDVVDLGRAGQGDQRAVRGLLLSKEAQLDDDIRLLGRVLGDVVREQAGERVFELVERVRRLSMAVYRDGADDAELVDLLCSLEVARRAERRARLLLLLLVGQHRRGRPVRAALAGPPMAGDGPQPGSVAAALDRLQIDAVGTAELSAVLAPPARQPGDHRPPDRGRPAHRARHPPGGRPPADRARPHADEPR